MKEYFKKILIDNLNYPINSTENILSDEKQFLMEVKRYICNGIQINKVKQDGNLESTKFLISLDLKFFYWQTNSAKMIQRMDFSLINTIIDGIETEIMKKAQKISSLDKSLCFSISTKKDPFDFVCDSVEQKQFWVNTLKIILKNIENQINLFQI
ncbi:hypothetical protein M0811_11133 [Anaeramoeba ignava]|uniref:PH domain-containing protein n=1 Tax=Anaeramoeba ignava TaxID=1746090 RepID=A0A9Q0LD73_ANAIG|nr:hypothetical protein M0811_11133 [Anaeramoeba ignava]